jgi:hypothetical protein
VLLGGLGWDKATVLRGIWIVLLFEAFMLWPQMILVDIATRIEKRPHWAKIALLLLVLMLIFGGGPANLLALLSPSHVAFVPFLLSTWQRSHMLWTIPSRSNLEKMRVRAAIGGRMNIAVVVTAATLAYDVVRGQFETWRGGYHFSLMNDLNALWLVAGTGFLLVAAFDRWRLGGAGFASNPRPIFRFDYLDVRRVGAGA